MSRPKMNPDYVKFSPHDWREEIELGVGFDYQSQVLANLKKVELARLKKKFDPEDLILIETDGACSRNGDHKGPGRC
jgi:hypothetical protein